MIELVKGVERVSRKKNVPFKAFESSKQKGNYTRIMDDMQTSPAWRALKGTSVKVYIYMKRKYRGTTPENISLTYNEASKIVNRNTFINCICDLIVCGFIEITREGGKTRNCNIFKFSDQWKYYPQNEYILPSYKKDYKKTSYKKNFKNKE